MESFEDHPSQKRAIGIAGAPIHARGKRRYSSNLAQHSPAVNALLWCELYKKNATNAMIDPGRTESIRNKFLGEDEGFSLGRNASPEIPADRPYSSVDVRAKFHEER